MVKWLARQEKMTILKQKIVHMQLPPAPAPASTPSQCPAILIAKKPQYPNYPVDAIEKNHNAPHFSSHLKYYLNTLHNQPLGRVLSVNTQQLPFSKLDIFTNFCFELSSLQDEEEGLDSVKAQPISESHPSGKFDTMVYFHSVEAEATSMIGALTITNFVNLLSLSITF